PPTTYTATLNAATATPELYTLYLHHALPTYADAHGSWTRTPPPTLTSLTPSTTTAGSAAFTLTADGNNFVSGATVLWNGAARTTTFVSATLLTASTPAADIAAAGSASVSVRNPDGQTSGTQTFTINPSGPLPPTLTTLTPN